MNAGNISQLIYSWTEQLYVYSKYFPTPLFVAPVSFGILHTALQASFALLHSFLFHPRKSKIKDVVYIFSYSCSFRITTNNSNY